MTPPASLATVILAAGKGTRMKSNKAKVLHELFFAPMIHHVMYALAPLEFAKHVVVVGHQRELVEKSLDNFTVNFVVQEEQLGTGHAVLCTEEALKVKNTTVMILCGDTPLIQTETLRSMFSQHQQTKSVITVMTTFLDNPTNYGRIITDADNNVLSIVEEKDASPEVKEIQEINAGIYCVDGEFLFDSLKQVGTENAQGEVYLTDIVSIAVSQGLKVRKYTNPSPMDVLGVNSRIELAEAHRELQLRFNRKKMLAGVTMYSPETILISPMVSIGQDTIVHEGVAITGNSTIGNSCTLEHGAIVRNCTLADDVHIGANSFLENCTLSKNQVIAPHTVLKGLS